MKMAMMQMALPLAHNQLTFLIRKHRFKVDGAKVEGFTRILAFRHVRIGHLESDFPRARLQRAKSLNCVHRKDTLIPSSQS